MEDDQFLDEFEKNDRFGAALKKHINGSVERTVQKVLLKFFAWIGFGVILAILAAGIAWGKLENQVDTNKTSISGIGANLSNLNSNVSQLTASVEATNENVKYLRDIFKSPR